MKILCIEDNWEQSESFVKKKKLYESQTVEIYELANLLDGKKMILKKI